MEGWRVVVAVSSIVVGGWDVVVEVVGGWFKVMLAG